MRAYWIKFSDGSEACCEGESDIDAIAIAEKVSGKTIERPNAWTPGPNVSIVPYPASPVVWQHNHPCHGKTPTFCHAPKQCKGRTACPQRRSCTE